MNAFLWLSSSLAMFILLALLAVRALKELLNIDLTAAIRNRKEGIALFSPAKWPWPVLFVASLAILWVGAYVAFKATQKPDSFFPYIWNRLTTAGDATHYIYIAEHGYARAGEEINKIVFFPLYPLLIGGLGRILGGHFALAGVIISQVCYGASVVVMRKLANLDCPHPGTAILAYLLYPLGFFSLGVFTESLFLLLTILGLYLIRTRRWLAAGIVSLLCALTRTQGVLLLFPFIYCAWQDCRERGWNWRHLALLCPLAGYGIYLIINKVVCGSFFAYFYYQSIAPWYQSTQWLGRTVVQQWNMALENPGLAKWIYWPQLLLYYIVAALLLWGYRRRVRTPHILYGTAYLGMCYTPSWLISGSRYLYGCIPMYLCVGSFKSRIARAAFLALELMAFSMFFFWFMQGQSIM